VIIGQASCEIAEKVDWYELRRGIEFLEGAYSYVENCKRAID